MKSAVQLRFSLGVALLLGGCATVPEKTPPSKEPPVVQAGRHLQQARDRRNSTEERAGFYLAAAEGTESFAISGEPARGREIYSHASAEFTRLWRSAEDGHLWNRPLTVPGPFGSYRVRLTPVKAGSDWAADEFDEFLLARNARQRLLRKRITEPGVGGTLVGVRTPETGRSARDPLLGRFGYRAPITATLDFRKAAGNAREAALSLHDPERAARVRLAGADSPLAGDFTAPLASFPHRSELILGLLGMVLAERFSAESGLFMLEPYHPERVPVILVHGLLSTPQMWLNTINEIEGDPELRGRVQFWVFWYPTGTPISLNALKLHEGLDTAQRRYGLPQGVVLVGHSMGGLLSRVQVTDSGRAIWNQTFKGRADELFRQLPAHNILKQALVVRSNPTVKREIFICVPHRGSQMAIGSIGNLGRKLISLPASFLFSMEKRIGVPFEKLFGKGSKPPTSIDGLSPHSPLLTAIDKLPIQAPHHSIIGDRGRGDTPNSSDGTVPYWSSHLDSAQSELIVPGPHGSYELPETIAELRRILKLHLRSRM
jgi:triacylglycerol esterase/lipase EstA (alpha/beta hydrolase family)